MQTPGLRFTLFILHITLIASNVTSARLRNVAKRHLQEGSDNGLAVRDCRSGRQLVQAIADPTCDIALVQTDVELSEDDWAPYGTGVIRNRNFTILGAYMEEYRWPMLDLGFVRNRVQLAQKTTLNISRVVVAHFKTGPPFQNAAMDLVANVNASARGGDYSPPIVVAWNAALSWSVCLPSSQANASMSSWPRPVAQVPGVQRLTPRLPQPDGCSANASAPPMQRCWAAMGFNNDTAMYGTYIDSYGKQVLAGYLVWVYASYFLCELEMSASCVAEYGTIGCYNILTAGRPGAQPFSGGGNGTALAPARPQALPPADGGGGVVAGTRLAALLAGLLGGFFLAGAVAVAAVLLLRRRRRRQPLERQGARTCLASYEVDSEAQEIAVLGAGPLAPVPPPWEIGAGVLGDTHSHAHSVSCRTGLSTAEDAGCTNSRTLASDPELLPVTPLTPAAPDVNLDLNVEPSGGSHAELQLLPTTLGTGAAGRVVVGMYQGQRVAVKLLNVGLMEVAGAGADAAAAGASDAGSKPVAEQGPPLQLGSPAPEGQGQRAPWAAADSAAGEGGAARPQGAGGGGAAAQFFTAVGELWRESEAAQERPGAPLLPPALAGSGGVGIAADRQAAGLAPRPAAGAAAAAAAAAAARTFGQEVEVLARCRHPNIIRLLAASLAPPRPCLVMELMDTSLDRLLHGAPQGGRRMLPLPTVLHIAIQVAQALSYLHPTVLHRDLKPANVLLSHADSAAPVVKLADFGLSRLRFTVLPTRNPEVGTFPYMAPELFDVHNSIATDRADVYALGVVLWEMLSGERPWRGMSAFQVACAVAMQKSRLPMRILPPERRPPKLRSLLAACWEHDPARRPAAAELVKSFVLLSKSLELATPTTEPHSTALTGAS